MRHAPRRLVGTRPLGGVLGLGAIVDVDLDRVRILEGVAAGEKVVLDPPATLADGAKVRVRATDARPGPAAGSAPGAR